MISHSKEVFAIERCIEIIKQANEYSTDIYSYAPISMKFTSTFKDMEYRISVNFKDNVVTSVSIYRLSNIEIKNSNRLSDLMSRLYDEAILAISRIENEKFKKIFPDYTIVEERDDRISDILDYINSQPETETETEKVETKTIFQKILEWF
jgi:hypothetical protein